METQTTSILNPKVAPSHYSAVGEMLTKHLNKIFKNIAIAAETKVELVGVGIKKWENKIYFCAYKNVEGKYIAFDKNFAQEKYLKVKLDLSGMGEIIQMFLSSQIPIIAKELECEPEKIEILLFKNEDFKCNVLKEKQFVKSIDIMDLLN